MSDDSNTEESAFAFIISKARDGNVQDVRRELGISGQFSDSEVIDGIVAFISGMERFGQQDHLGALEPLKKAQPIIDASNNAEAKLLLYAFIGVAEGLTYLFDGDAHRAVQSLTLTAGALEHISQTAPDFKNLAYSMRAASLVALARAHLNAANIKPAEEAFSRAREVHDELLRNLDPENPAHVLAFSEVYGTRIELMFAFAVMLDLPTLDLSMMRSRIEAARNDALRLEELVDRIPTGPISNLFSAYPILFRAFDVICKSLEIVTTNRRPFRKHEAQALATIDQELFRARQLVEKSAGRGRGLLHIIDQLGKLQKNLLPFGKAATQDFGRFSGIVSLVSLLILIVALHLTIQPTGWEAIVYFVGCVIVSLIVGFGFGALRFQPLLKLFANAMHKDRNVPSGAKEE